MNKRRIRNMVAVFAMLLVAACSISVTRGTAAGSITNFAQTAEGTTASTIGLRWDAYPDAAVYVVKDVITNQISENITTTTYTVQNITTATAYVVGAYDANGNLIAQSAVLAAVPNREAPSKVPSTISGYSSSGALLVQWSGVADADGYEVVVYDANGKQKASKEVSAFSSTGYSRLQTLSWAFNLKKGNVYQCRVRSFIENFDETKVYGAWSKVSYVATPKKMNSSLPSKRAMKVKVKWSKVKGATGYALYASNNKDKGYKKVKSVKPGTTSIMFTKVKGKKLAYYNTYYYQLKVAAKVKLDGKSKKVNIQSDYIGSFRITKVYSY